MPDTVSQQDIVRAKVTYGRRMAAEDIETLAICPRVPSTVESNAPEPEETEGAEIGVTFSWKEKISELDQSDDEIGEAAKYFRLSGIDAPLSFVSSAPSAAIAPKATVELEPQLRTSSSHTYVDDGQLELSFNTDLTRDTMASQGTLTTPPTSSPAPELNDNGQRNSSPVSKPVYSSNSKEDKRVDKKPKSKPPTKKERVETAKEQVRILSDRPIMLERDEYRNLSMNDFFAKLDGTRGKPQSSDPITGAEFNTSPTASSLRNQNSTVFVHSSKANSPVTASRKQIVDASEASNQFKTPGPTLDSDGELDLDTNVVAQFRKEREQAERTKKLKEMKLSALRAQSNKMDSEGEIEIEFVNRFAHPSTRPYKKPGKILQKQMQMLHAKISRRSNTELLEISQKQAKASDLKRQEVWRAKEGSWPIIRKAEEKIDLQAVIEKGARNDDTSEADESDVDYCDGSEHSTRETQPDDKSTPRSHSRNDQDTDKENIAPSPFIASPVSAQDFDSSLGTENDENICPNRNENISPSPSPSRLLEAPFSFEDVENTQKRRVLQRKHRAVIDSSDEEFTGTSNSGRHEESVSMCYSRQPEFEPAANLTSTDLRISSSLGPPLELRTNPQANDSNEFDDLGFSQIFADEEPLHDAYIPSDVNERVVNLTQDDSRRLPLIPMSGRALQEEEGLFRDDAEEKRRENDGELRKKKGPTYINIQGFLTQTKPVELSQRTFDLSQRLFKSPNIASQVPAAMTPVSQRLPLGTISHSPLIPSDEDEIVGFTRRLRRRGASREVQKPQSTRKKSFEGRGERKMAKTPEDLAEFIVDEAEESDEEAQFAFGNTMDRGENTDEDLDGVVEGLLDDTVMEVDVENSEKVIEKYQEQEAAADAAHEKAVQEIVDGKRRGKRRDRRVGLSDSDDSEDSDSDRRRHICSKKRKVKNDDLEDLAKNPDTNSFHREYMRAIDNGDNAEFGYLGKEFGDQQEWEEGSRSGSENIGTENVDKDDSDPDGIAPKGGFQLNKLNLNQESIARSEHAQFLERHSDDEDLNYRPRYREIRLDKQNIKAAPNEEGGKRTSSSKIRQGRNLLWAKEEKMTRGSGSARTATVVVQQKAQKRMDKSSRGSQKSRNGLGQSNKSASSTALQTSRLFSKTPLFES